MAKSSKALFILQFIERREIKVANITKNQIKARLKKLVEKLEEIKNDLSDLQMDVGEEIDNIEPYENKEELTLQQEERQEWLQETSDTLESQCDNLDDLICELDSID